MLLQETVVLKCLGPSVPLVEATAAAIALKVA